MGNAAGSTLAEATRTKGEARPYLLSDAEVAEEAKNAELQRCGIAYCTEYVFVGAPTRIRSIETPGHHCKSALVDFDEDLASTSQRPQGWYPESCVVDPRGTVAVTASRESVRAVAGGGPVVVTAEMIERETSHPGPVVATAEAGPRKVVWRWPVISAHRFEASYREVGEKAWRDLAAVDVFRGDAPECEVVNLRPATAYEFRLRARNRIGWSKWAHAPPVSTPAAPPSRLARPVAGLVLPEAVALFWRPPQTTNGAPVRGYELRARRRASSSTRQQCDDDRHQKKHDARLEESTALAAAAAGQSSGGGDSSDCNECPQQGASPVGENPPEADKGDTTVETGQENNDVPSGDDDDDDHDQEEEEEKEEKENEEEKEDDDEEWRVVYSGRGRRFLATGLEAGASYEFSVTAWSAAGRSEVGDILTCRTPSGPESGDGYAENASLLRAGDLWLECWDPRLESVFYFNRATGARETEAPPELRNRDETEERPPEEGEEVAARRLVSEFRVKRFRFLKNLRARSVRGGGRCNRYGEPERFGVRVRRGDHLLDDSLKSFKTATLGELKTRLKVEYDGEPGVDSGGLTKDWYLALSKALQLTNGGFFSATDSGRLELRASKKRTLADYRTVGRFLAKAVYDQHCVDLPLAPVLYSAMRGLVGAENNPPPLGEESSEEDPAALYADEDDYTSAVESAEVDVDSLPKNRQAADRLVAAVLRELEAVDAELCRSLRWILDNDIGDGSMLCATFSASRARSQSPDAPVELDVDLIEGGSKVDVDETNKVLYVFLAAKWRLRDRVAMELDAVLDGLSDLGLSPDALRPFTNTQLHLLFNGRTTIDVDELRALTAYQNMTPDHIVALLFWQVMHDLHDADKRLLLKFATGSSRLPLDGLHPQFTLTLDSSRADALPSSHTCFNQLVLPLFDSYANLKTKLLFAAHNSDTFEMS